MNSLLLFFFPLALTASLVHAGDETRYLDTSAVAAVVIEGDAGTVRLNARPDAPYNATLRGRSNGWFSGWSSNWFFGRCDDASSMRLEGAVLHVDIKPSAWMDLSDCVVELEANIPKAASVDISLKAVDAKLAGEFSTVNLSAPAADVALDGHADTIALRSQAMRARLKFGVIRQTERIDIDARELYAYLDIGSGVPVSYSVAAKASYVDSALANVPGAKPDISVRSDHALVTIR